MKPKPHVKGDEHKISMDKNSILGIGSMFVILLVVCFTISFTSTKNRADMLAVSTTLYYSDSSGYAAQPVTEIYEEYAGVLSCSIILGLTANYDYSTMTVTLESGSSITYAGNTVSLGLVNDDGCVVDVGGESEYLALGQIQRVGQVYVTVKDIVK